MKKLGVFAVGMCLGLIFGAIFSGDRYHYTTYMLDRECLEDEDNMEETINEE